MAKLTKDQIKELSPEQKAQYKRSVKGGKPLDPLTKSERTSANRNIRIDRNTPIAKESRATTEKTQIRTAAAKAKAEGLAGQNRREAKIFEERNVSAGERANKRLAEESERKAKDKAQQNRAASAENNRQQRQSDKNRTANNKEAGTRTGNRQASERAAAQERRGETSSKATAKQKVQTAAGKPKKVIKKAVNNANTKVSEANTKVGNAVNKVKTKVSEAANQIKTKASDVSAKGLGKALEDIKGDMKEGKQESQNERNTKNKTKEKPADSKSPDEKGKTKNKTKKPKKTTFQQIKKQAKKLWKKTPSPGDATKATARGLKGIVKGGVGFKSGFDLGATALDTYNNPEAFNARADQITEGPEGGPGLNAAGANAFQFLSDFGNRFTGGAAGRLGEAISNNLNGQGLNTDETLRQDALSAANPNAAPEEIANPANAPFQGAPQNNPNAQALQDGNFVAPVGLGSNNPFGRTAENQAAIDANVAEINQVTDTNKSLREARTGGAGGLSPEQKQITKLARSLRTGSIGDKQRNNGINQEIAALSGVSRDNTLLGMNRNNNTTRLLGDQLLAAQKGQTASNKAATDLATLAAENPELASSIMATKQADNAMTPGLRSLLKQPLANSSAGVIDGTIDFFGGNTGADTSTGSFAGYENVGGGGWLGSLVGMGDGLQAPGGVTYRRQNYNPQDWRNIQTAVDRDRTR